MQDKRLSTEETSERHVLTLAPGRGLMGLSVYQIDHPHQITLIQTAETTARHAKTDAGMQGCAIFRAIGKGDVAVLTQYAKSGRSGAIRSWESLLAPVP